ncbi:MAG: hypothetical protein A2806_03485 [Candidatus Terrybacteria bacterium RIFCSPHIGHO2_01_FULL_48_17]|uniref:Nudix hydrolase domain-containing protein n=1 Tax=Candidatus Terrybacteria bacterium RIFCSPHIGHO2_01_FULL_48_17 TaxID=1802362 RepID=A0A1G2PHA2_9BACT|nr:MAG: hypothetical protein A2806_03485 [Candidatus Terrybacteria bacterium RIFCSPHIGHO2_01_FULL_48_17]OHA53113.1 MAG: hypothetical protein A3A30_01975 [Candidatus Terrybacteria bacterium RIFCSPLOWO2_01_FULL_48_14]
MDPWPKLREEPAFRGRFRKIDRVWFLMPNAEEKDYEIAKEGEVVVALALTPDRKVILTRQFRPGPQKVLLELPAGWKNLNESPQEAIERELLEETGYAGNVRYVVPKVVHSAYSDMQRHVFVVENCTQIQEPSPDDSEFIDVVLMSLDDFRNHLRAGQLSDVGSGYLALDFLDLL